MRAQHDTTGTNHLFARLGAEEPKEYYDATNFPIIPRPHEMFESEFWEAIMQEVFRGRAPYIQHAKDVAVRNIKFNSVEAGNDEIGFYVRINGNLKVRPDPQKSPAVESHM